MGLCALTEDNIDFYQEICKLIYVQLFDFYYHLYTAHISMYKKKNILILWNQKSMRVHI